MNPGKSRIYLITLLISVFIFSLFLAYGCSKKEQKKQSETEQKIQWNYNLDSALTLATGLNKPLMIDFMATWCPPCKKMEDSTFSDPDVIKKAAFFVPLRIDVDKHQDVANKYNSNAHKYGGIGIPNILFMTGNEKKLKHIVGYSGPKAFIAVMDSVLALTK